MTIDSKNSKEKDNPQPLDSAQGPLGRLTTRREFLKLAGIAGATIGIGAGLGGLVAACGGATTTTTAGATTTTAAGGATTTVSAGPTTTAASSTTTTAAAGPVKGGHMVFGAIGNSADNADPNKTASTKLSNMIALSMYDNLVYPSPDRYTFDYNMLAAEEVTMEDPSTWIIRLRQGMTFHNGKPVTADDLIYSFQYEVTPGSFTAGALDRRPQDHRQGGRPYGAPPPEVPRYHAA